MAVTTKQVKKVPLHRKLYSGKGRNRAKVTKVLRDIDVLKLREDGMSYEDIAEYMTQHGQKMTSATAANIVNRLITNILSNSVESIENVRQLELRRLDKMEESVNKMFKSRAKAFVRLGAADRLLKIQERRAKLQGLEIKKVEHTGEVGVRVYYGVDAPPELQQAQTPQLESNPPVEAEFEEIPPND